MKKSSIQSGGFLEDFLEWMGSPEGVESMDALDWVFNTLDGATVEPVKRKINWPDGESLSIEQSVDLIAKDSGLDRKLILSHIIGWLQMEYMPEGLDEKQMELFENQIESWLENYENDLPPTTDS
jgi:hypothetical protein